MKKLFVLSLLSALVGLPANATPAPSSVTLSIGYTVEKRVDGKIVETNGRSVSANNNVTIKLDQCSDPSFTSLGCHGSFDGTTTISGQSISIHVGVYQTTSFGTQLELLVTGPGGTTSSVSSPNLNFDDQLDTQWTDASGAKYDLVLVVGSAL